MLPHPGTDPAHIWPNSGQLWSTSARTWSTGANFGRTHPKFDAHQLKFGQCGPTSVYFKPTLLDFGPKLAEQSSLTSTRPAIGPKSGRNRGRHRSKTGRLVGFGPTVVEPTNQWAIFLQMLSFELSEGVLRNMFLSLRAQESQGASAAVPRCVHVTPAASPIEARERTTDSTARCQQAGPTPPRGRFRQHPRREGPWGKWGKNAQMSGQGEPCREAGTLSGGGTV